MNVETTKWRRDAIDEVQVDQTVVVVKRRRRRNLIIAALAIVAIAVAAIFLFGGRGEQAAQAPAGAAKGTKAVQCWPSSTTRSDARSLSRICSNRSWPTLSIDSSSRVVRGVIY